MSRWHIQLLGYGLAVLAAIITILSMASDLQYMTGFGFLDRISAVADNFALGVVAVCAGLGLAVYAGRGERHRVEAVRESSPEIDDFPEYVHIE